jgi:DNA-binding transcriptional MocR family regulator
MESKIKMVIRGTVGSVAGPSVAMVEHALATPGLRADMGRKMDIMRARFDEMQGCLDVLPEDVTPLPFNSAFFAVFLLPDRLDAERVRQQLITEGVGVISLARSNAIRVAYCSLDQARIRPLMERVGRALAS